MEKQRLSNSSVTTYLSCPKKYYWTYIEQLRKKSGERSQALLTGDLVHRLIHWHNVGTLTLERIEGLPDYVKEQFPDVPPCLLEEALREAVSLIRGYFQHIQGNGMRIVSSETHLELDRGEYLLYARLDGLARTEDDRLWRSEIKTTAKTDNAYLNGLKGGLQAGISHLLLQELYPEKVYGSMYSLLVKTKVPQYYCVPQMLQTNLIKRTEEVLAGVIDGIMNERFYPSMQCFNYFRECDFSLLCQRDTKMIREEFYEHRPPTALTTED